MGARPEHGGVCRSFFITHTPSIIFLLKTAVVIVRVLHGACDAAAIAREEDGFEE
jgi:plasmid stabilization system protein ParE